MRRLFTLLLAVFVAVAARAEDYQWTNFVGMPGGFGNVDGTGNAARFLAPTGVAFDGNGNLFVSDRNGHTIRKISSAGVVTTYAGLSGSSGTADGTGSAARFFSPWGLAADAAGNVYVADRGNNRIRKIAPGGVVTTLAGTSTSGSTDGLGTAARFNGPTGVAVDGSGTVYVADTGNSTIRKISPAGQVTTLAGSASSVGSQDGTGSAARFMFPAGVAVDGSGTVYVADQFNATIRKVTAAGVVTTLAGSAGFNPNGPVDGTGASARFIGPASVVLDANGDLYVADSADHTIRKVTSAGVVTTVAGTLGQASGGPFVTAVDGTAGAARFGDPTGITISNTGDLYVADNGARLIRKVTTSGVVTTPYGSWSTYGIVNGVGSAARMGSPRGMVMDGDDNLYVAEGAGVIRKVAATGEITTFVGAEAEGSTDGTGSAARFDWPRGLARDSGGNLFVTEYDNHTIRKVTPQGVVSTFAGLAGSIGSADGAGSSARFRQPDGVVADAAGNLYVADSGNHTIRKIASDGVVTTLAGSAGVYGAADGPVSSARFHTPVGLALDTGGNLYVADRDNGNIRKITPAGTVSTLTEASPYLTNPTAVAVDGAGNLYVTDEKYQVVVKITSAGVVSTIGGTSGVIGGADGVGPAAGFAYPNGIIVSSTGELIVAESANNRLTKGRLVTPAPVVTLAPPSPIGTFTATLQGTVNPQGLATTAVFSYGLTKSYGSTANVNLSPNNGSGAQSVSNPITDLLPGTTYHFRLTATNSGGESTTGDATFTTLSNNANLAGLTVSGGTLDPAFAGGTTVYTMTVPNALGSVVVIPTVAHAQATVTVNGTSVASGSASAAIAVTTAGDKVIPIVATAQDGTTKSYQVTVTRQPLPSTWAAATDVPLTVGAYTATGSSLGTITLGFAPVPGQVLTLVNNTGTATVTGTFSNALEGTIQTITQGGNTYSFALSYVGGDGNDITLRRVASAGQVGQGTVYEWTNFAGQPGGLGNADGAGRMARFFGPSSVAVDGSGNAFVADTNNHTVRKVSPAGVVTTWAGLTGMSGSADGQGGAARFQAPAGVAVDGNGNVYVSDRDNHTIRRIASDGTVTTLAGLAGSPGSADGTGSAARFNNPIGVAVDGSGNVYVADRGNHTIRMVTAGGVVTTLAGTAASSGTADGTGSAARFNSPAGLALGPDGLLYVADSANRTIRTITSGGVVVTLAGNPASSAGTTNGTGSAARFHSPTGVAVDGSGIVYVADSGNHTIRKISAGAVVTTYAGSAGTSGLTDATGVSARFNFPMGVGVDAAGNVLVADSSNHNIRLVSAGAVVTTFAGLAPNSGTASGLALTSARLKTPNGVAVNAAGAVFIADYNNHAIRRVLNGSLTTFSGSTVSAGSADGTFSRFNNPFGVTADPAGNLYVADSGNHTIRKVNSSGQAATFAGLASNSGSTGGTGTAARFSFPCGVAVDASGNVYVADSGNHTIRKITSAGVVTTLAGTAGAAGSADGFGAAAGFSSPAGIALGAGGYLYVADQGNHLIRKVASDGTVTTLAGAAGIPGSTNGAALAARFNRPTGIAVDADGNVFVAEQGSNTIRKISSFGLVSTIGGTPGVIGSASGTGAAAGFAYPGGLAVSASGVIYVGDADNNRIAQGRLISFTPIVALNAASGLTTTSATIGGTVNPNGFVTTASLAYGRGHGPVASVPVSLSPDNDTTAHAVSANLTGLAPGATYFYRLTATNADGTVSTADGTFVTPVNLADWKLAFYGDANLSDTATPDNDGIAALTKYALLLPTGKSAADQLPAAVKQTYEDGTRLAITFLRDPARSEVTIEVQAADSLAGPWTTIATSIHGAVCAGAGFVAETDAGEGLKRIEVRDVVNIADAPRRFLFIKITR